MKKALTLLFIGVSMAIPAIGQSEIDTLYYDKDWKGVENKAFATYFRIIPTSTDSNFRKQFRDYYITGELQSEGGFITIDRYDDSKSIFDGQWTNYYKSGKVEQKGNRINGKQEGEYTKYKEDGLVSIHANFRNDKLHGIYTEFSEDGNLCIQVEYSNGEPLYDYYVVSNKDGFCSKMRLSDNQPIYETPSLNEKEVEYKDGEAWPYYNKNVRRSQNWAMALNGLAEGLAAANAGYSSSTTNSSYSGYSSSYGSASAYGSGGYAYGNYSGNSSYYGRSSSTTTSYNGAAAYQAQVIASNRIAAYDNALLSERAAKNEGYLKRTTIYPGETISGYINIERKKGVSMTINVDINGAIYTFPWNINH